MVPKNSISVALATLNGERFLPAQLATIAAQTLPPNELIVVDDGSTDKTIELIESFRASAPFEIRIFRNPQRLGYRRNFMRAASLCRGEFIAFCDQDDIWAKDKFATLVNEFSDPEVQMVYHNADLIDANERFSGTVFKKRARSATLGYMEIEPWRIVPGFTQVIRRSLVDYNSLQQHSIDMFELHEEMPHDQWYLFLASVLGKVRYVANPLASYRLHGDNVSGWLPAKPLAYALHCIAHANFYVRASHKAMLNRIKLLEELRSDLPMQAEHLSRVLDHYAHVTNYVRRRLELYSERSFMVRIKLLTQMIRDRTYSDPTVKFGRGSLTLDALIGASVGRSLR